MTPSLIGRIQTRIALLATVGLIWTVLVTPVLPRSVAAPEESVLEELYSTTFGALFTIALLGVIIWEPLYHVAQQLRWDKDWPILIGLLTGIPEGLLAFAVVNQMVMEGSGVAVPATFWVHFTTTWIIVWMFANGPMRVVLIRWRYRGGRIL